MSTTVPRPRELRGRHVLMIVVGFFAVVVGLDIWFAVLAVQTFPGETSKTPYEDGLAYNHTLARRAREAALGWTITVAADTPRGVVEVRATDGRGRPIQGGVVQAVLGRPATDIGQIHATLRQAGPGVYRAQTGAAAGAWNLKLQVRDASGQTLEAEGRETWP